MTDDELGFRRSDIITVCGGSGETLPLAAGGVARPSLGQSSDPGQSQAARSQASPRFPWQIVSPEDEHCWVAELNGLRSEASSGLCHAGLGSGPGRKAAAVQGVLGVSVSLCPQPRRGWEAQDAEPPPPPGLCFSQAGFQPSSWKSWMSGARR